MLAITTKYHGPTNYRGSRITARVMEDRPTRRLTLDWDYSLNPYLNHCKAATALIHNLGWTAEQGYGRWIVGSCEAGYVFVCDTKHGNDRLDLEGGKS